MFLLPDLTAHRKRKNILLGWLIVLLGLGLALSARPVYHLLKIRRARNFDAQTEELIAAQRWKEAYEKAQAALQLNPADGRAFRALAEIFTHFRNEEALQYWRLAFQAGTATVADRQKVIDLALQLNRLDAAELYLTQALAEKPVATEALRSAALFCEARNDPARAIQFSRALLDRKPFDLEAKLLLARHLLATRQPADAGDAKVLLWQLVRNSSRGSAEAFAMLVRQPGLSREETEECLQRLNALAKPEPAEVLLARDLELRLEPKKRSGIIAKAIDHFSQASPAELLLLARWLNRQREFTQVIDVVPLDLVLRNRDFFLVYADAAAALGRWAELEQLLAREKPPIDPVLVELYRARVARELKKGQEAELHWAQAHWLAAQHPQALGYLADYAEKLGETAEAVKAYRRLARDPKTARPAYTALVRLAEQKDDTAGLRDLMKELTRLFPDEPAPRNDLAYLELLLRENVASAKTAAQKLVEQYPRMPAYRTTLALAFLRLNDPRAAKAVYDRQPIDWSTALPGWQAVYAAVLGASGDTNGARQVARGIARERLKTEERTLVAPWL
jgi:hypothetical protein